MLCHLTSECELKFFLWLCFMLLELKSGQSPYYGNELKVFGNEYETWSNMSLWSQQLVKNKIGRCYRLNSLTFTILKNKEKYSQLFCVMQDQCILVVAFITSLHAYIKDCLTNFFMCYVCRASLLQGDFYSHTCMYVQWIMVRIWVKLAGLLQIVGGTFALKEQLLLIGQLQVKEVM